MTDWTAEFLGTRGLVKVDGTVDGHPFRSTFMPLGDGTYKLPIKADFRQVIDKQEGDTADTAANVAYAGLPPTPSNAGPQARLEILVQRRRRAGNSWHAIAMTSRACPSITASG